MSEKVKYECSKCGTTSDETAMMSFVFKGQTYWVCVHCLPALIHG
ncbi:MAG: hypothetical protein M0Z55_13650 [Peptococcaceae bacterium]|nr:hypothetical protein [Peptococcaceae bacterium]